jgi:hypothetical protein
VLDITKYAGIYTPGNVVVKQKRRIVTNVVKNRLCRSLGNGYDWGMGAPPYILIAAGVFFVFITIALVMGSGQQKSISRLQEEGLWPANGQEPTLEDVKRLAKAGHKIPAIKMYRIMMKVGLKEAKDAVEDLAARP